MRENADASLRLILKHEGGWADHRDDPGGATNRGVTIGTLKRLGIDKDGDGDSDIVDLRKITEADAVAVFKRFYWDAVLADLLPSGVDYAVTDFAVNSGPVRAAQHLQRLLGVDADGHIGPKTMASLAQTNAAAVINAYCERRLVFMRGLPTWGTFKGGWTSRVADVRKTALMMAAAKPLATNPVVVQKTPQSEPQTTLPSPARPAPPVAPVPVAVPVVAEKPEGLWSALWRALLGIIRGRQ